jgi:membrane fusion protein (multidrug efflux system)
MQDSEPSPKDPGSGTGGEKEKKTEEKKEGDKKGEGKEQGKEPVHISKKAIVIGVIVFLVLLTIALFWWLHARQFVSTDDAYTTGHVHQISARVSGTVQTVWVDDNQSVDEGAVLVELDPRDYEAALQKAQADRAQAEAQVKTREATLGQNRATVSVSAAKVDQARSQVTQEASQQEKARLDYERVAGLYSKDMKAVSKADVDAATASFESARSAVEGARANVAAAVAQAEAAQADLVTAQAQVAAAQASVASAQATEQNAELQLSYCKIVAPVGGKISKKTVETGQQLQPGQALMAVVPEDVWVIANLKETQLEQVQVGQRVDIEIDTLPHEKVYGSVNSIQEGSGATFSLLPPDNATGNFTKIVQRVPVKIVFDPDSIRDFRDKIVPGLSCEPHIDLRGNKREPKRMQKERKQNEKQEEKK